MLPCNQLPTLFALLVSAALNFGCLQAEESPVRLALENGSVKEAIGLGREAAVHDPEAGVWLAVALHNDQETEEAFTVFLSVLNRLPTATALSSPEDQALYQSLHPHYLALRGSKKNKEATTQLKEQLTAMLEKNPSSYQCGYLLASTYANEGDFAAFFPLFYRCYSLNTESYLAYRTLAILQVRLWQRGATPTEKEMRRAEIERNTRQALQVFNGDASLYRLHVEFADPKKKCEALRYSLNNITQHNILIPRDEIVYYVQAAIEEDQLPLGQQLINKARSWYKRSRAIDIAQRLVDQHR